MATSGRSNPLDAYRLALQYGLSDAVIVGSNSVGKEGVDHGGRPGYVWQPYEAVNWPQVAALDPDILGKIMDVRSAWQREGVPSSRRYPAQIVKSQSGKYKPPAADLFRLPPALEPAVISFDARELRGL